MSSQVTFGAAALVAAGLLWWRRGVKQVSAEEAKAAEKKAMQVKLKWSIFEEVHGYWATQVFYVACKLNIAEELESGPKTLEQLVEATGANKLNLHRFLRVACPKGLFTYDWDTKLYSLNELSKMLIETSPNSMKNIILLNGAPHRYRTLGRLYESVMEGSPQMEAEWGAKFYDFLRAAPAETQEVFNKAMAEYGGDVKVDSVDPLAKAIDFSGDSIICDVGGGTGSFLHACLEANPHLRGMVFDQQRVHDKHIDFPATNDRTSLVAGSFFEEIPCADTFLLKNVIHDWDEPEAIKILTTIRAAMTRDEPAKCKGVEGKRAVADRRLLLLSMPVDEDNWESAQKWTDMMFMCVLGGQERSLTEFKELFAKCGLELVSVTQSEGRSSRAVLELRAV